jgi:transposase
MVLRPRFITALCAGRGAVRSRGGRNTKIHALADVKGRLIAILLSTGEAHDCPVAGRLARRVKPSKWIFGDKAYGSTELREDLHERGTKPVIPNRCNRKQPFSFSKRLYKLRWQQVEGLQPMEDRLQPQYAGTDVRDRGQLVLRLP